jgi:hypothetical protein
LVLVLVLVLVLLALALALCNDRGPRLPAVGGVAAVVVIVVVQAGVVGKRTGQEGRCAGVGVVSGGEGRWQSLARLLLLL